jgi:adenylate cyclase
VPLGALGWIVVDRNEAALNESARTLHLAIAADVRRAVRGELSRVREELTGIGQLLLSPGLGEDEQRLPLVEAAVTSSESFDFISLYGPDGALAGSMKAKEVEDPEAAPSLDEPTRAGARKERVTVAGMTKFGGAPALRVVAAVLVGAETRGYLVTAVPITRLSALVAELGEERLGSRDRVYVVDEQRRLVIHADPARVLAGESVADRGIFQVLEGDGFRENIGIAPEFVSDGRAMLGALETVPEHGWAVVVERPRAIAYASLETMRRSVLIAAGAAALLAALAAFFFARRLTRPIAWLVDATRAIAARAYAGIPARLSKRSDELGTLGRAVDKMAVDLRESEQKVVAETQARGLLSRYLSPEVVELVLADPDRLRLRGEQREVTVMFADVCGFTQIAEDLTPERTVALLNEIFTFATEIVHKRGGMIDKFIGDAVMAVWGAPESRPDDAVRAVHAAEDLRRWVETGNRKWRQQYGVEISLAIGINTGKVVAGNIGSEKRVEYTVVGDVVNVASRLESMAQPGQILISEATQQRLGVEVPVSPLGEKGISGRARTTIIFEVPE